MKYLGKKIRLQIFNRQLQILERLVYVTDPERSAVFREKTPFDKRDKHTVGVLKNSFEMWRQQDISQLKTLLYHVDPCPEKSNYNTKVFSICKWAEPEKNILFSY